MDHLIKDGGVAELSNDDGKLSSSDAESCGMYEDKIIMAALSPSLLNHSVISDELDAEITREEATIIASLKSCLELRAMYIRASLQTEADNPKNQV